MHFSHDDHGQHEHKLRRVLVPRTRRGGRERLLEVGQPAPTMAGRPVQPPPPFPVGEGALNVAFALATKPTLLGGIEKTMTLAALAEEHGKLAVLTSAFESGVAHSFLSLVAAALPGASVAHGLSTFERLERDAFQPPFADLVRTDLIDVRAASSYLAATTTQCDPSTAFAQSGGL